MLSDATVTAMVPVVDLERAKRFYGGVLGLKPSGDLGHEVFFGCDNGTRLFLYERAPTKADHTAARFEVQDIEAKVAGLKAQGVVFIEYGTGRIKTVDSIATFLSQKAAWFEDTEGNILGLASFG